MAPHTLETPLAALGSWLQACPEEVPETAWQAATDALEASRKQDGPAAAELYSTRSSTVSLVRELRRELPELAALVDEHGAEGLARWLEPLRRHGPNLAERTREQGDGLTAYAALVRAAYALWWDRVRAACIDRAREEQEERERRHGYPPALPLGLLEAAQCSYWSAGRYPAPDDPWTLLGAGGRPVARVARDLAPRVAVELGKAGGVTPLRLFRYVLREVTKRWADHDPRPEELRIRGCLGGLAEAIGAPGTREVRAALELGQGLIADAGRWTLGGLWTWSEHRGSRHYGPGWLRLTLSPELAPMGLKLSGRAAWLVPFPDREPPMVGSPSQRGPQLALQHVFMAELRQRSRELVRDGAVRLDLEDWRRMAARVGLRTSLEAVLQAWQDGTDDADPFLAQPEPWRWTLTPDLEPLIRFIQDGEAMSAAGRRGARKALENRHWRDREH